MSSKAAQEASPAHGSDSDGPTREEPVSEVAPADAAQDASESRSSGHAASSVGGTANADAASAASRDSAMRENIEQLRRRRDEIKKTRLENNRQLRNCRKKVDRLRKKARRLTTDDLMEVYAMRVREQGEREARLAQSPST